jgi:hypothetical protein
MRPEEPSAAPEEADHPDADPAPPAFAHAGTWRVPRPVLLGSLKIALILMAPLAIVDASVGGVAALAVAMGYTGSLTPALTLRPTYSLALALPAAMTGVVAAGIAGQALAAACFVALACLLVAPANIVQNGLLSGIPTIAAVYACLPARQDPVQVGAWMLVGGAIVVGVSALTRRSRSAPVGVDPWTAWAHAIAMAGVVGVIVLVLGVVDIPHGYWIAMTMTIVLRPYGTETQSVARQRVVGTTLGTVLALALAVVLPGWAAFTVAVALLVLVVANALMGRYSQQVMFLTPFIVLVGSGSGEEAVGVAVQRVAATLLGALLAAGIALALWRVDQARQQT